MIINIDFRGGISTLNKLYVEKPFGSDLGYYFLKSNDFYTFGFFDFFIYKYFKTPRDEADEVHKAELWNSEHGVVGEMTLGSNNYYNIPVKFQHYYFEKDFKNLASQISRLEYRNKSGKFSELFSIDSNELDSLNINIINYKPYCIINDELYNLLPYAHDILNNPYEDDYEKSGFILDYEGVQLLVNNSSDLINK